jgi:PBSX family phage terminase large subunit
VEQALARCSVEGSKFWFSCNPGSPRHWFYTEWIEKRRERGALYLHFTMDDNPSLSPAVVSRDKRLYSGAFYQRYVLGKWVAAHGAVYPMFSPERHVVDMIPNSDRYIISCDYGTVNPASFGLWGHCEGDGAWYRIREYYHDSRREGIQRTDEEYCDALEGLAGELPIESVLVDPSAASFIQSLRRRGKFLVRPAKNDVAAGIRQVASALSEGRLKIHRSCGDCIREFGLYRWNLEAQSDMPVKEDDHAMDEVRYFVASALAEAESGFAALGVARK